MIAAISPEKIPSEPPAAPPKHWLDGRYFVPLPDLADETRQAIYAGRAAAAWMEITTRLRSLERRGPDEQAKRAAVTGRIEGLGVNGLAAALGCSHTTALKYLRHLESLGLIRTEQGAFTTELDPATGRIKRNYAKAPPKVIVVAIEDRHCRPCRPSETRRGDTPGTSPKASGDTPETGGKVPHSQDRNWRHSRERTSKEVRSYGTNKRRTAAGPQERPAAAVATKRGLQAGPVDPAGEWQRQADEAAQRRAKEHQIERLANGLGVPAIEVVALMRANPAELRRIAIEAGILTPDGQFVRILSGRQSLTAGPPPAVSSTARDAIKAGIEELSDPSRLTPEQAETLANVTKATKAHARHSLACPVPADQPPPPCLSPGDEPAPEAAPQAPQPPAVALAAFLKAGNSIMEIRERAEASGRPDDLERAREAALRIVRKYVEAESEKAVA